jgi:hypothetical protein
MRKIVARVGSKVTALRCTDCGWTYSIHHLSQVVDDIEEQQAIRLYTIHDCQQFPADEGKTLKAG